MLYERRQIPDLYYMKHSNDSGQDYIDYENSLLNKTLSPYMFNNDIMNSFLEQLQVLVSILFDEHNVIKNFKNYIVDKYYFKHPN